MELAHRTTLDARATPPIAVDADTRDLRARSLATNNAAPQRPTTAEQILTQLVTFAVVVDEGSPSLELEDAVSSCGLDGAVVKKVGDGEAKSRALSVGDLVVRVNDTLVLAMPFALVADLVKKTPLPRTIEFVPSHLVAHACCVAQTHRDALARINGHPRPPRTDKEMARFLVANKFAVIQQGVLNVHVGSQQTRKKWHVVMRLSKIECFARPGDVWIQYELHLADASCSMREVPASSQAGNETDSFTMAHALKLHVGEETVMLVCESAEEKVRWMQALAMAIDASKTMSMKQDGSNSQSNSSRCGTRAGCFESNRVTVLYQLIEHQRRLTQCQSYRETKRRRDAIVARMESISSAKVAHPDPLIEFSLREEYKRLKHDHRIIAAQMSDLEAEEKKCDREVAELAFASPNVSLLESLIMALKKCFKIRQQDTVLKAIRRYLPVNVEDISESELLSRPTPNGKFMPPEIARRCKQSPVLFLLRRDPRYRADRWSPHHLSDLCPSTLHDVPLTEQRALYQHLRTADLRKLGSKLDEAKYTSLVQTLRRRLEAYNRHIARYGSAENHRYATDDNPEAGCPLRGSQCPLRVDIWEFHKEDLGYPGGPIYCAWEPIPYFADLSRERPENDYGFLVRSAANTYGSSSIWRDPTLLELQLNADALARGARLTTTETKDGRTDVYAGVYEEKPVAIKRLRDVGKTLEHATALAFAAQALARLEHRNLVSIMGVSYTKALDIQIVTPLLPRGDLRTLLDAPDAALLTWSDFKCQVAIDVIEGLDYLHRRDAFAGVGAITSWNVLLDEDGTAQLNLLQLANCHLSDAQDRVPSPLRWIAPEVILGGRPSQRSDIYSFGVLLTELDTTKRPFHDATSPNGAPMEDMAIAFNVARRSFRPRVSPECPSDIAKLTKACLAQDPQHRPSGDSIRYRLREFLKGDENS